MMRQTLKFAARWVFPGMFLALLILAPGRLAAQHPVAEKHLRPAALATTNIARPLGSPVAAQRYAFGRMDLATSVGPQAVALGAFQTGRPMSVAVANYYSASVSVFLGNPSGTPITIGSLTLTGAAAGDFTEANNCPVSPATLAPGATRGVRVTFKPTATGPRRAKISVSDSVPGSPQVVTLVGTGT